MIQAHLNGREQLEYIFHAGLSLWEWLSLLCHRYSGCSLQRSSPTGGSAAVLWLDSSWASSSGYLFLVRSSIPLVITKSMVFGYSQTIAQHPASLAVVRLSGSLRIQATAPDSRAGRPYQNDVPHRSPVSATNQVACSVLTPNVVSRSKGANRRPSQVILDG
jgi:hypothetical protein